jgi:zinc transport system substrate-binding protein
MRYIISFLLASATPLWAEVPRVVADTPAVQSLTAQVMGDLGTPMLLLEKGGNAHDFQLRPSQAGALAGADLVVWVGPELTPWLERAMQGLAADVPNLALLDAPETRTRDYPADDHGDHEADDDGDGHSHHGHDPHAWLDPQNASIWLGLIAAELSRLDPDNAATYSANAAAAQLTIADLDSHITTQLAAVRDKPFVVFHDAYGYFAAHYGLNVVGSIALGDATVPGAARLSALRDSVAAGKAVCLFPEMQHDPALISQIAEGSSARIGAPLDPEGRGLDAGPAVYGQILQTLADRLTDCLAQ